MQKNQNTKYRQTDKHYRENHITAWQESGLSQSEYCRQNDIPLTTFVNWKRKTKNSPIPASSFIELKGYFSTPEEYFELQVDKRLSLRIRESIPPVLLRNIITGLRGM